jgi:hypothetical protein
MFDTTASVSASQTGEFFEQLEANMLLLQDICAMEGMRRGLILANCADPRNAMQ